MKNKGSDLLEIDGLCIHVPHRSGFFRLKTGVVKPVDEISLKIPPGKTLGLVGESGSGKSALGKAIVRLSQPSSGKIYFEGRDITRVRGRKLRALRKKIQMVFQDSKSSLNPRMSVGQLVEEPLRLQKVGRGWQRRARVAELLERVELPRNAMRKFPYEFSAGQCQRIAIARALALDPKLIVLDGSVSDLDVSIQAQIMNLLLDLQEEKGMSYLFMSHDFSVVKHMSDMVAVMYLGKVVEMAPAEVIYQQPLHAYTKAFLSGVPNPSPFEQQAPIALQGDVPSALNPPAGCAFGHRVGHVRYEESLGQELPFEEVTPGHWLLRCPCCGPI